LQERSYYVKEALLRVSDVEMDRIAQAIQRKQAKGSLSLFGVFSRVFLRKPVLLWKAFRLLG
jgi:hypothetical protein